MHTLHVHPIRGRAYTQPLSGVELVIGRSRGCDLVLNDEAISRRHARLFYKAGEWYVEDLQSRNGTLVNDVLITEPIILDAHTQVNLSGNTLHITEYEDGTAIRAGETSIIGSGTLLRSATDILSSTQKVVPETDDQAMRVYTSRLTLLNEVHNALSKPLTSETLLDMILERVFEALEPEEACIFLKREERLEVAAHRSVPGLESKGIHSATLIKEVSERGHAAIVADVATDERFSASTSMVNAGIRSLLAAPLIDAEGSMGMIVLASRIAVRSFSEEDMALLVSLASLATLRIRNITLMEENARALRDANLMLERKVAERTAALEQTNDELRTKNEAILRRQNQLVLQEKMASVGTMAAGVAHFIKNPLNFVKNLSEVSGEMVEELTEILDTVGDGMDAEKKQSMYDILSDLKANAEIVHSHGNRADQIIVNLMEYAREPAKADRRLTDINALVEKYTQLAFSGRMPELEECPIDLSHRHQDGMESVTVFAGELSRTLIGILNNAVDAILEKYRSGVADYRGKIETSTQYHGSHVEISITDNGIGINEKQKQHIFTPFFTTKHDESHIGLGLSIGYDTVTQRHNGSLSVKSEEGNGARFSILLPTGISPTTLP